MVARADMTDIFIMYYEILVPVMEKQLPFLRNSALCLNI